MLGRRLRPSVVIIGFTDAYRWLRHRASSGRAEYESFARLPSIPGMPASAGRSVAKPPTGVRETDDHGWAYPAGADDRS